MHKKKRSFLDVPGAALSILSVILFSGCMPSSQPQDTQDLQCVEFHVDHDRAKPFSSTDPNTRPSLDKPGRPGWNASGIEPAFWLSAAGSRENPFATLYQAQLAVRELLRTKGMPAGGIKVIVHGGFYRLEEPLVFVPEDSGTSEHPVVYEAAAGDKPIFSGGEPVIGWKKLTDNIPGLPQAAKGNIWAAPVPRIGALDLDFRQLYINGKKATRARTPNAEIYNRLSYWDVANRQVQVDANDVAQWQNLKCVEMVLQQSWVISCLRLDSVAIEGDKARITFQNPERNLAFSHPFPWARHTDPYHFVNALEFLDSQGEWYLDKSSGVVYYWPQGGEDMTEARVIAPRLETLVCIKGSPDRPVHDIQFAGLTFEHSTWMRPTLMGHVPLQAGQYFEHIGYRIKGGIPQAPRLQNLAWTARPPAAVYLSGANHIGFEKCVFQNMASAAVDFHYSSQNNSVVGCVFNQIGGNGVQVGKFSENGLEAHVPYTVTDLRELSINDRIANSYFNDCAGEDWGCVAIAAGYPRGLTIEHNEITNLPYTGITVGWGWTPHVNVMRDNKILFNRIHRYMQRVGDGGAIYMLSNQMPSEIRGNYIYDLRKSPVGDRGCMIYLDEGSSGILVKDNRTEKGTFFKNTNGPGNRWENTGPGRPLDLEKIPDSRGVVGIEPGYRQWTKEQLSQSDLTLLDPPFNAEPIAVPAGTIYQAEDALFSGDIKVKSNHDGYLGEGFVVGSSLVTGHSVAFKVKVPEGGQYHPVIRYTTAAKNPQSLSLYVNGRFVQSVNFKPLTDLDIWGDMPVDLTLKKGKNTILLKKNGGDGSVNLDYLVIP
jgi:hypothetical protein